MNWRDKITGIEIIFFASVIGVITFCLLGIYLPAIVLALLASAMVILLIIRHIRHVSAMTYEQNELQGMLEKKEKIIADFSHKIRTPLNNFSIIVELLGEKMKDSSQKELLETLIASTSNMITAVNDLTVDSARELSFEPRKSINFNLVSTLQNTVELFGMQTERKLRIKIIPKDNPVGFLCGDPIAIKQIFLDLLNMIETAEHEDLDLEIIFTTKLIVKNKYRVDFNLVAGKPIRYIKYNPENPSASDSLSVKLILRLGGSLSGCEGMNREFSFSLPLLKPAEEIKMSGAALRIRELKSEIKESKKLSDANILLVEDNPTNQKIVMISLSPRVKNIDTAVNGKEALDLFGKSNYDLILMDVQLPVMDGITAVQKIRELEASTSKHTPVIAITANAMLGDKEKCISAGMDEYLSKPFHPNQLISLIERLIAL